ncbi:MAG: peptidylprolyl isomerase [Flavobacteriales bacterium]|nr:peptidylprolyl isomerase [Flavobacteriales bacterium]|tara:strand:- start:57540 stop:58862 length:1323 start_codon:yes stop_codon:yes gene_type:complete
MNRILYIVVFTSLAIGLKGQSIDKIEAVIGDEIVLRSDIESQYLQYLALGNLRSDSVKCEIIEDLLFQRLLINQAKLDSVVVSDEEIDAEIEKRIAYFESQLGTIEKVEEYFGKIKLEIELELGKIIKDQFLAQKVQGTIASDVKVTPSEVKDFYTQINADLPMISEKVEILQIVIKPEIPNTQKNKLRDKLNGFRERVYNGEDFKMLATLYSDDPGSASNGGELGFVNRGDLVPEFERAAFRLKKDEISEVIETQFGFHIVQLIERRGEQINVRHILLKTKVSSTELYNTKLKIEKVENEIMTGDITFEDAIVKYSNHDSKNNKGLLLNPNTMSSMYTIDDMPLSLKYTVDNLQIGEVSSPVLMKLSDENQAYRILKLNKRIDEHKANLIDDFSIIKDLLINARKQEKLIQWIQRAIDKSYIKINDNLLNCSFKNKWVK